MLFIRASTAAVRARMSRAGPNESPVTNPWVGKVRIAVNADSAPAMAHASIDIRLAKMPDIRAASGLAAAARIPSPARLRLRKTAMASTTIGDRKSIALYAGVTRNAPTLKTGIQLGSG